ncbi:MAG TPA: hypothetical protein VIX86_03455 [Streptosporangiaceae bacterium]
MGIFSWFASRFASTRDPEEPRWVRRLVFPPPGKDNPKLDEIKRAAAADVEAMEKEKHTYFRPDGPGDIEDDL